MEFNINVFVALVGIRGRLFDGSLGAQQVQRGSEQGDHHLRYSDRSYGNSALRCILNFLIFAAKILCFSEYYVQLPERILNL